MCQAPAQRFEVQLPPVRAQDRKPPHSRPREQAAPGNSVKDTSGSLGSSGKSGTGSTTPARLGRPGQQPTARSRLAFARLCRLFS